MFLGNDALLTNLRKGRREEDQIEKEEENTNNTLVCGFERPISNSSRKIDYQ